VTAPAVSIAFRPATPADFDYCARLYFDAMDGIIRELGLDMARHRAGWRQSWVVDEVRIIVRDTLDVGWLQSAVQRDALFLGQLYVDGAHRRQGIGTAVMAQIIAEAAKAGRAVTLGVVKINPALALYRRLGFVVTGEDAHKFYMRLDPTGAAPAVARS
jgi:ribosomal protein S18 acetylase RimI-like enzyme